MTTIVTWKTLSLFHSTEEIPGVFMIADSRVSQSGSQMVNVLTDRCAKLFEIDIRVHTTNGPECQRIGVAVAGNSLVAHNCVFCMQQILSNLGGESPPILPEVAEFANHVLTSISLDVSQLLTTPAQAEVIIMGTASNGEYEVISVRPSSANPSQYLTETITSFPYVIGSDAKFFLEEYEKLVSPDLPKQHVEQLPFLVFDRLFLNKQSLRATGGEMQILVLEQHELKRYSPQRWNPEDQRYECYMFGIDISRLQIGNCCVGARPWLLDDIQK
ncbi:MAG: hypothetical protein HY957_02245 [Nitrospirae bacterium]|nr:hypothetical protein [Nitrospirota bacterium]